MEDIRSNTFFDNDYRNSLVSIHPSLAMAFLSKKEQSLIDMPLLEKVRLKPNEGAKTKFVIELIRLAEPLKEKVLVFCQYIEPLELIRDQLVNTLNYVEGKDVLKMDGQILSRNRRSLIDVFNDSSSEAKVLLASTKACCEGISLVGASRVVLIDVLWNPSTEHQAISRAYRIGQERLVYIYQLITLGTGESGKYGVQATKDKMSKLVFSHELDLNGIETSSSHAEEEYTSRLVAEDKILEKMRGHDNLKDIFRKIYYQPKESNNVYVFSEDDMNQTNNGYH